MVPQANNRPRDQSPSGYLPVPSVTWIADYWPNKFLEDWRARQGIDEAEAIKKAAGEKGSVVHLAIDRILKGEEFRIDTKVEDKSRSTEGEPAFRELTYEELLCVMSFINWRKEMEQDYVIETIANEITIFSEINGYAGTVDWVVRLTPKARHEPARTRLAATVFVVDFKTSKQISRAHKMQVSAYRVALENGENPLYEKNPNGTETDKMVDVSGLAYRHPATRLRQEQGRVQVHRDRGRLPAIQDRPADMGRGDEREYARLHATRLPDCPLTGEGRSTGAVGEPKGRSARRGDQRQWQEEEDCPIAFGPPSARRSTS